MTKKDIKQTVISLLFIVVSVNLMVTTINMLNRRTRLIDLENEVAVLKNEKNIIENTIEYKKTDAFVEDFARNELNLIKPGEDVVVIANNTSVSNSLSGISIDATANSIGSSTINTPIKAWMTLVF